ncbi:hypothetical protein BGZ76_008078 [Entomortierella beljakovae]|nr:hypothetical protein BGZ76_008078 [Entomortierella beljakovae]
MPSSTTRLPLSPQGRRRYLQQQPPQQQQQMKSMGMQLRVDLVHECLYNTRYWVIHLDYVEELEDQ